MSLDGDGSTTYMITCAAMLPLYQRLGLNRLVLACVVMMAGQLMNILPWGGPTARAVSALHVEMGQVFVPMILPMVITGIWCTFVAFILGLRETRRLGAISLNGLQDSDSQSIAEVTGGDPTLARPKLLWVNAAHAGPDGGADHGQAALAGAVHGGLGDCADDQLPQPAAAKERLETHAANIVPVVSLIFAAWHLRGHSLSGTKMVDAIANSVISMVPDWMGPYMAVVTAVLSIPFTFFISNDAFYFGILPILAKTAAVYGIGPVEIARAPRWSASRCTCSARWWHRPICWSGWPR